jgi:hypothetical protein
VAITVINFFISHSSGFDYVPAGLTRASAVPIF